MNNILIIFTTLTIINVIFSTIKSILTVKGSPLIASLINGLYYGYYNIVILYTVADFPLWQKVVVTTLCNIVGVFVVKYIEKRARKDKLWKVEATIPGEYTEAVHSALKEIPHSYIKDVGNYTLFNFYCATQKDSLKVKQVINLYGAKYFVSESKTL